MTDTRLPSRLAGPPPDGDRRRTRVMTHTCGGPVVVAVDELGGWRYVGLNPGEWLSRCPRCGRRLLRRALRAVGDETVRSDAR